MNGNLKATRGSALSGSAGDLKCPFEWGNYSNHNFHYIIVIAAIIYPY